jgi:histidine triad (HIT) family protein
MGNCVFCSIVAGVIPGDIIYQNSDVVAFRDIHPQARVHVVIVPRRHLVSLNHFGETDSDLLGELLLAAKAVARLENVDQSGYRVVMNCGSDGGQVVQHAHLHVLGGQRLMDEMG